jgi:Spy/CpxP family protein refolding chaperone
MVRRSRFVTVGALMAVLAGGALTYAQGPGPRGRGPGFGPEMRPGIGLRLGGLDLTEAQQQQIRQLREQHREQIRPLVERLREAHQARAAAMTANTFNEGEVRAAMQQLAVVEADLAVQQARLGADIRAILTPEQVQQLETSRAEREARMKERFERMQQRRQERQQQN